jgi:glycosyltransferase involved in cell wall biosynthesis
MACGLPVVTTDAGGSADAVVDGVTGAVVPIGDRESLTSALVSLADRSSRVEAGRRARQRALADYTLEAFGRRFEAILTSLDVGR